MLAAERFGQRAAETIANQRSEPTGLFQLALIRQIPNMLAQNQRHEIVARSYQHRNQVG
jgi:hypothetical protein